MRHGVLSLAALGMAWPATAAGAEPERVLTGKDTADNIEVRLVATMIDNTRGQFLHAKFAPLKGEAKEIEVRFPGHSHTTHETTLINLIHSCTAPRGDLGHEWKEATMEAVFSIPKDLKTRDFSRWYLVSIKVRDKK